MPSDLSAAPALLRIARRELAWFASDLHLQDDRESLSARFHDALGRLPAPMAGAPSLFLLGDLFEFWVGDDHASMVSQSLSAALRAKVDEGWQVWLMHGNRDFLLGAATVQAWGATLLPDPCVVEIEGERIVLAHGDAQCVDDTRYQQWRALCRSEAWQADFLGRPRDERLRMAAAMREQSRQHQQDRPAPSMTETSADVDEVTVDALMTRLGASGMIHGHTHRPAVHRWQFGSKARWRAVLSDWECDPPRGEILSLDRLLAD